MTETSLHRVNTCTTYISLRRRAVRCSCSPSLRSQPSPNCSPRSTCSRSVTCSPSKSNCSSSVVGPISPAKARYSIPDQCTPSRANFASVNNACASENCVNRRNSKTSSSTFLPIPENHCDGHCTESSCEGLNSRTSMSPSSCVQESGHPRGNCPSCISPSRSVGPGRNGALNLRERGSPVRAASLLTPQGVVSCTERRHVKYMEDQL